MWDPQLPGGASSWLRAGAPAQLGRLFAKVAHEDVCSTLPKLISGELEDVTGDINALLWHQLALRRFSHSGSGAGGWCMLAGKGIEGAAVVGAGHNTSWWYSGPAVRLVIELKEGSGSSAYAVQQDALPGCQWAGLTSSTLAAAHLPQSVSCEAQIAIPLLAGHP